MLSITPDSAQRWKTRTGCEPALSATTQMGGGSPAHPAYSTQVSTPGSLEQLGKPTRDLSYGVDGKEWSYPVLPDEAQV